MKTPLARVTLAALLVASPLTHAAPLIWNQTTDETISTVISGSDGIEKSGTGTLTLSGTNTFTGNISISAGVLEFTKKEALGTAPKEILLNGGTLRAVGVWSSIGGGSGNNHRIRLGTAGGTIDSSGSGGLGLNNTSNLVFEGTGSRTLTLAGTNTGTGNNIGLNIINQSGSGITSLEKTGTGVWSINGTNTYTGATSIKAGTFRLASATTLQGATGDILIQGGTLSNSVATTVGGHINLSSGQIDSETTAAITLASGKNFTMSGGTWTVDLLADGSGDQINGTATGAFAITGGTLALALDTGFDYSVSYSLLSGFSNGSVSGLAITGYDTGNWIATLGNNGALSFSAIPEPATASLLAGILFGSCALLRRRRAP